MTLEENRQKGEKIALTLMYDGLRFCGWQVQKNARSVQSTLQDALQTVLGYRPDVCGCSRTDSSVHANNYVCHILKDGVSMDCERLTMALNAHLWDSGLAVKSACIKNADFHARYSCTSKEYIYKIWNEKYDNPFLKGKAMFYPRQIDIASLSYVKEEFCGTHDFRSFMSKGSKNENNTVRTVKYFDVERCDGLVTIRVCADGFLYNMVRSIAGTLMYCGVGKIAPEAIPAILASGDREQAGPTAPACGLYMSALTYNMEALDGRANETHD